jgi:hypothetical protein
MQYDIKDDSNDRKFFTIVPNYILNHSTAIEQSLYLQMKRLAGENGLCFITQKHLCERLGIGRDKLRVSLEYLIDHKWIEFVGTTESKTRPINTYRINDIWKLNVDYYQEKKISPKSALSSEQKDKTQNSIDKTCNRHKIKPESTPIRRSLVKKDPIKKKYSSLKDLGEKDFEEIAERYGVKTQFVRSKFEDLSNYCEAKNRRYSNYKAALRNFVKKSFEEKGGKFKQTPEEIEARRKQVAKDFGFIE